MHPESTKSSLREKPRGGELRSLELLLADCLTLRKTLDKLLAPSIKQKKVGVYQKPKQTLDLVKVKVYQRLPTLKPRGPLKVQRPKTTLEQDGKKRHLSCTYCDKQILYTQLHEHSYACEKCFLEQIVPLM